MMQDLPKDLSMTCHLTAKRAKQLRNSQMLLARADFRKKRRLIGKGCISMRSLDKNRCQRAAVDLSVPGFQTNAAGGNAIVEL